MKIGGKGNKSESLSTEKGLQILNVLSKQNK